MTLEKLLRSWPPRIANVCALYSGTRVGQEWVWGAGTGEQGRPSHQLPTSCPYPPPVAPCTEWLGAVGGPEGSFLFPRTGPLTTRWGPQEACQGSVLFCAATILPQGARTLGGGGRGRQQQQPSSPLLGNSLTEPLARAATSRCMCCMTHVTPGAHRHVLHGTCALLVHTGTVHVLRAGSVSLGFRAGKSRSSSPEGWRPLEGSGELWRLLRVCT